MLTSNPELYAELLVLSWVGGQSLGFWLLNCCSTAVFPTAFCFFNCNVKPPYSSTHPGNICPNSMQKQQFFEGTGVIRHLIFIRKERKNRFLT